MSDRLPPPHEQGPPPGPQGAPPQYGSGAPPSSQYGSGVPPPPQYGSGAEPSYGPGAPTPYGQPAQQPHYPRQELLPQDVLPARSRLSVFVGIAVVLALVAGGITAWLLLRDNGESTRAQYCAAIKKLAPNNDLVAAVTAAGPSTVNAAKNLAALAPGAVDQDWKTLSDTVTSMQTSSTSITMSSLVTAFGAMRTIVQDSNDNCGTAYKLPLSP